MAAGTDTMGRLAPLSVILLLFKNQMSEFILPVVPVIDQADALYKHLTQLRH